MTLTRRTRNDDNARASGPHPYFAATYADHIKVNSKAWLSTNEAAEAIGGITKPTLYRLINNGELTAFRVGRVLRVHRDDIANFLERNQIQPGTLDHLMARGAPKYKRPA